MSFQSEHEIIIDKLVEIRDLFDVSDMEAEGHGMEDAVASPYAVACYAESKMKRLIEEVNKLKSENTWLYSKLNQISDVIEKGRKESAEF